MIKPYFSNKRLKIKKLMSKEGNKLITQEKKVSNFSEYLLRQNGRER